MSAIIPSDTHLAGDTGHTTDHNNISDVLHLLAQAVAELGGTVSTTDATNLAAIAASITSSDWYSPLYVIKPADEAKSLSNTTPTPDGDLIVTGLKANAVYEFTSLITYSGVAASSETGIRTAWRLPSGAVLASNALHPWWPWGGSPEQGSQVSSVTNYTSTGSGVNGGGWVGGSNGNTGADIGTMHNGIVTMAGTGGSLTFCWSNHDYVVGNNTWIRGGSYIILRRLA